MQAPAASDSPRRGRRGRGAYLPDRLGSCFPASAQIGLRRRTQVTLGTVLHPKPTWIPRYKRIGGRLLPSSAALWDDANPGFVIPGREASMTVREKPQRNANYAYLCACILLSMLISGVKLPMELSESGGGGRSALRPGSDSRACRVDRPPALFSNAEENPRPIERIEPAYSSSTGDGSGSGDPDWQLNSRRMR